MIKINHLSVVVKNPEKVSKIIAELTGGKTTPFRSKNMIGAWMCFWDDSDDLLIEFYPEGFLIVPTETGANFKKIEDKFTYNATHINLATTQTLQHIKQVADHHGLHHHFRPFSGGPLYEVWIENQFLIEFVSNEIRNQSLNT